MAQLLRLQSKLPVNLLSGIRCFTGGASTNLPPRPDSDHAPPPLTQLSEEEQAFQATGKLKFCYQNCYINFQSKSSLMMLSSLSSVKWIGIRKWTKESSTDVSRTE